MQYKIDSAFPTQILTLDLSSEFSNEEIKTMTDIIDNMIDTETDLQLEPLFPKYQSRPIMFRENQHELFSVKLQTFFYEGCKLYIDSVKNFCINQNAVFFTYATSWFYCSWPQLNVKEDNPWHCHNPSFLSGVFYLKNPNDPNVSGTEFHDPRGPMSHTSQMCFTPGVQGHLVIFPGWLYHKSMIDSVNVEKLDRRYTMACNAYAAIK